MKHISDITSSHLSDLHRYCDDNGNLPESLADLKLCRYNGDQPDTTTDSGYDAWSDFVWALKQAVKVAEGTAARIVEELAARSGAWKYDD